MIRLGLAALITVLVLGGNQYVGGDGNNRSYSYRNVALDSRLTDVVEMERAFLCAIAYARPARAPRRPGGARAGAGGSGGGGRGESRKPTRSPGAPADSAESPAGPRKESERPQPGHSTVLSIPTPWAARRSIHPSISDPVAAKQTCPGPSAPCGGTGRRAPDGGTRVTEGLNSSSTCPSARTHPCRPSTSANPPRPHTRR